MCYPINLIFIFFRDLAVIVASMAYNTWFTKLYCKDLRIVSVNFLCCCWVTEWGFNHEKKKLKSFSFLFVSGVRGHRAGPAYSQQILQPRGDNSGERWVKIVSFNFVSCDSLNLMKVKR